ncbi:hypothetical protein D3C73_1439420 [compost metagenome]
MQILQTNRLHLKTFSGAYRPPLQAGGMQGVTGQAEVSQAAGRGPENRLGASQVKQAHLRIRDKNDAARFARFRL